MAFIQRLLCFVLLCLPGLAPRALAGTWEDANAAFASGDYNKALTLYQDVLDQNGATAARLYNLGNTHAKLGQNGLAVLCYERAALLSPRDAEIQSNLKLARPVSAASLTDSPPLWKAPLYWLSLHEWSWITALGLTAVALPLAAWLFLTKRPVWLTEATPWAIGGGAAFTVLGSLALLDRSAETRLAILTGNEPVLRLSPFAKAEPITALPPAPGTRVIPGKTTNGWTHVTLPGTETAGWIPQSEAAPLIPDKPL